MVVVKFILVILTYIFFIVIYGWIPVILIAYILNNFFGIGNKKKKTIR